MLGKQSGTSNKYISYIMFYHKSFNAPSLYLRIQPSGGGRAVSYVKRTNDYLYIDFVEIRR